MPVQLRRKPTKRPRSQAARLAVSESRRREIVAEAVRLMEEKGFAAVSVQHVANALAFSKANFYHHIKSKEKLLYEVFVDTLQFAIANIGAIVSSNRAMPEKLNALVEFYVSLMLERRAVMLVWFKERAHLTGAHLAEVTRLEQQVGGLLKELYGTGIEEGYFRRLDLDLVRHAIFGMCFHLTKLPPTTHLSRETITSQIQELASGGLLIAPAREKP